MKLIKIVSKDIYSAISFQIHAVNLNLVNFINLLLLFILFYLFFIYLLTLGGGGLQFP